MSNDTPLFRNYKILAFLLALSLHFSCSKSDLEETTVFKGRVFTNGTEDIVISNNGRMPRVVIYKFNKLSSWEHEIASGSVNSNGAFEIHTVLDDHLDDLDRSSNDMGKLFFYFGISDLDRDLYYPFPGKGRFSNSKMNQIHPGQTRTMNIYADGIGEIVFRFINTNSLSCSTDSLIIQTGRFARINGCVDSTFTDTLQRFGGHRQFLTNGIGPTAHFVRGKLTRDNVTRDVRYPYTVVPFATSIVEIEY